MKILCLIPVYFLVLVNAGQRSINEASDCNQFFDEMPRFEEEGTTAVTVLYTIEKDIFYSSSGTFYTIVKLDNWNTELKAELSSSCSKTVFNQCDIKPSCSSNANVDGRHAIVPVNNQFCSLSEVIGPLVSDYINWGYNIPASGLKYVNYNDTIRGPQIRTNQLGFALSGPFGFPSFFESLIDEGIISNPTLCLAVKSSCSFNSEDEAAGKLLIGKDISEVFPNFYDKFRSYYLYWALRVTAASISGEDIFSGNQLGSINTSTPYIVMDKVRYTSFLNKLQNKFGVECLDDGPTNKEGINVCYVDCAMANNLPRIGLTLGSVDGTGSPVEYFLENNLVKFSGDDRCSLAIAGYTDPGNFDWHLGTSFFNGKTICFERNLDNDAVYIESSGL